MEIENSDYRGDEQAIKRLEKLANLLDSAIPLGKSGYRIGLDPILGLIPGLGDVFGTTFSSYIILQAAKLGVSRLTIIRMMLNVLLDYGLGLVPILGDLFDFAFRANNKNITLLKAAPRSGHGSTGTVVSSFFLVAVFISVLLGISITVAVLSVLWLFNRLT